MGADATMVFFGVRFATTEEESDALSNETDPRMLAAINHQLDHWWGSYSQDPINEQEFLFVGKKIVRIGYEHEFELVLALNELRVLAEDAVVKLRAAGFSDKPQLYVQFAPDF
ncbi:hypothetical protein Pla108_07130 [Botrimarina colliarenosi]|uniref:Uncharacterized protein n=1 Tax=Botrimarina colliarenosi TaxID=2528001 RepID=A0A5C6AK35_9BACT|nr:hypothetical protein [Botrimarina colliarenosi]TWT99770.1 hypothetical protein Pla108_07130 [Botrimarina colliarenosi]